MLPSFQLSNNMSSPLLFFKKSLRRQGDRCYDSFLFERTRNTWDERETWGSGTFKEKTFSVRLLSKSFVFTKRWLSSGRYSQPNVRVFSSPFLGSLDSLYYFFFRGIIDTINCQHSVF